MKLHKYDIYKNGFTLAEVLVTLGIIGVVSAMTVPTLMQNHQRKTYVVQLHKVYNDFSQAALRYMTDRNALNLTEAGLTDINSADSFMKTYFKIVKDCGSDASDCVASEYKKLDGTALVPFPDGNERHTYILTSGAAVHVFMAPSVANALQIHVDVNGAKGPNIIGRDVFALMLYRNGVMDDYANGVTQPPLTEEQRETSYTTWCNSSTVTFWGCFGKLLNDNWEMTY